MKILRTEYPRPDFIRSRWQSLNGVWDFSFDDDNKKSPREVSFDQEIRVPLHFRPSQRYRRCTSHNPSGMVQAHV